MLALLLTFGLALVFLRRRRHLARLHQLWLPAALLPAFSIPDALLTLHGTWNDAAREADPFVRACLTWGGLKGLCAVFVVWILGWTAAVDGLETLRGRPSGRLKSLAGCGQLYILYAVALGHLDGLTSWTHAPHAIYRASSGLLTLLWRDASWSIADVPLAYVLYPALVYGALFAAAHAVVAAAGRHVALPLGACRVAHVPPDGSRPAGLSRRGEPECTGRRFSASLQLRSLSRSA